MKRKSPLYLHANGQWCKQINKKKHYFGVDEAKALARYEEERVYLETGRTPPDETDEPSLDELVNVFMANIETKIAAKELEPRAYVDYKSTLTRLVGHMGKNDRPSRWKPSDFADIKDWLFLPVPRTTEVRGGLKGPKVDRRSITTVSNDVSRIRAFLNWCQSCEHIPAPRYGREFSKASAKQRRQIRTQAGRRDLDRDSLLAIIEKATIHSLPVILLGINGGMGAKDISLLTREQVNQVGDYLDCPRNKTAMPRKIWLWPETREAIARYMEKRSRMFSAKFDHLAFLTSQRSRWVSDDGYCAASKAFQKIAASVGVSNTFYDLRRTFQTVADETLDFPAVKFVMGHAPASSDMSAVYRQVISDERIERVCRSVREWLFVH